MMPPLVPIPEADFFPWKAIRRMAVALMAAAAALVLLLLIVLARGAGAFAI